MKETIFNIKFAWQYIKDQKLRLFGYAASSIFTIIISVILPILSAQIIVNLTSNKLQQVLYISLVILGIELTRNLFNYMARLFNFSTNKRNIKKMD